MARNHLIGRISGALALLACAALLPACGGGGGNPGAVSGGAAGTAATAAPTLTLAFVNASGQTSNTLSSAAPLTASAVIKDKAGKAVANALVAFATDNTLALLSPSAGTALTDANGVASVNLRPANLAIGGAGTVTATATVAGSTLTAQGNYSVGAAALTLGPLSMSPAQIAAYGSTVISVDVLAGGAKYTEQKMTVNFTSGSCVAAGKASMAATATTSNGTAQVVYRDQGCGNNDAISASVAGVLADSGGTLTIAAPTASSVQFSSALPTNQSIVIQGQGGNGRLETATLKFKVFDIFGNALPGKNVTFSVASPSVGLVSLNKTNDTTDANGEVITTVNSGPTPTTFRIKAALDGTTISTLSDSIVVTTGLPVQRAFSLTVVKPNVEGWTYDSGTVTPATLVNVLLADQAGNPVPDGTPLVFQTNMGSVGSSSKGACNTVNGGCSVDFRTQAPRVATPNSPATPCNKVAPDSRRAGLATVCASTTDGSNTLFAKIAIFFSGSFANKVFWMDGASPDVGLSGMTDLGTVGATESKVFTLQINDVQNNPMPSGTTVAITDINNASSGGVSPASVQNVFPHNAAGQDDSSGNNVDNNNSNNDSRQGSLHRVKIDSSLPKPCIGPAVSTFNVTITTPIGNVTSYPFKLAFSCP